jgi:peptidoglycan/LPS O-acetylase OafA/YrhL
VKTTRLTTSESLALDVIRVVASAVVAFGHLTQSYFSTGWRDYTYLAQDSVAVFFVLSGFVIRYVTCRRAGTFGGYLSDRASRIYSVAIPALLFTALIVPIVLRYDPALYNSIPKSSGSTAYQLAINLAFLGQLPFHATEALINLPYWSVTYEVAYYVLYGCFFYLSGKTRWLSLLFLALLAGTAVLYLFPLWIAGCITHDLYQRWNEEGTTLRNLLRATLISVIALGIAILLLKHFHLAGQLSHYRPSSVGDRLPITSYAFGGFSAIAFIAILSFARRFAISSESTFVKVTRFISEGTFPLYLLHFPLLVLIAACIPYNHAAVIPKLAIFFFVLLAGILAGHPCNLLKDRLRNLFQYALSRPATSS